MPCAHSVAQAGLELVILLPYFPEYLGLQVWPSHTQVNILFLLTMGQVFSWRLRAGQVSDAEEQWQRGLSHATQWEQQSLGSPSPGPQPPAQISQRHTLTTEREHCFHMAQGSPSKGSRKSFIIPDALCGLESFAIWWRAFNLWQRPLLNLISKAFYQFTVILKAWILHPECCLHGV